MMAIQALTSADSSFLGDAPFGESEAPSISSDGQLIVFESTAANLVANDFNGDSDVFLYHRATKKVSLVSVALDGEAAGRCNQYSAPAISPDGRYVVFESQSQNAIVPGITGDAYYVRDLQLGVTLLLTPNAAGTGVAAVGLYAVTFSADSKHVFFVSTGTNAVDLTRNLTSEAVEGGNIFKHDLESHHTSLVTRDLSGKGGGIVAGGGVFFTANFAVSADGRYAAFLSDSANYIPNDNNSRGDVFVRDTIQGTTTLISVAKLGGFVQGSSSLSPPTISGDGRYVTFVSDATGLTSVDPNGSRVAYVRDLQLGETTAISVKPDQTIPRFTLASDAIISSDGSTVIFAYSANLLSEDNNVNKDIYAFNQSTRTLSLVSANSSGSGSGNADSGTATYLGAPPLVVTPDGRYAFFRSGASNLVQGVVGTIQNLYRRDLRQKTTQLVTVSVDSSGGVNMDSDSIKVSADGRFVAFQSRASNLVSRDTNYRQDIFVRDVLESTTSLASLRSTVLPPTLLADRGGTLSSISADGRLAVFTSFDGIRDAPKYPSDYDPGRDMPYVTHVLLRDTQTQIVSFVDLDPAGIKPLGGFRPRISAGGTMVVFLSNANVDAAHPNPSGRVQVFVRDLVAGTTKMASRTASGGGTLGNIANDIDVTISADGRYVVWQATGSDVVEGMVDNTNGQGNLFLFDCLSGVTKLISHAFNSSTQSGNGFSKRPVFNLNGTSIAFVSQAKNLVTGVSDTNNDYDLFVYNIADGSIELASTNAAGTGTGDRVSGNPESLGGSSFAFSPDGRFLIFASNATNLTNNDTNGRVDLFRRDLLLDSTILVSINSQGTASASNGDSLNPSVSQDGNRVAFQSTATNLVAGLGASGLPSDAVYVRDLVTGLTSLVSVLPGNSQRSGNGASRNAIISPDGRFVSFTSFATDLVSGFVDGNGANGNDLFIRDLELQSTGLVTMNQAGTRSGRSQFIINQPDVRVFSSNNTLYFNSTAPDLISGDRNQTGDVFSFQMSGSSSIRGKVYLDDNRNGQWDSGETKLRDWIVFLDTNSNGQLDVNEQRLQTDAEGGFAFANRGAGPFSLRIQTQIGYASGTPVSGVYEGIVQSNEQVIVGMDFGMVVARPDLALVSVAPQLTGRIAGVIDVAWVVRNQGVEAVGGWQDAIYLSPTPYLSIQSLLVGTQSYSGVLDANGQYNASASVTVPSILPGAYYVIVQTDRRGQLETDLDRDNNVLASQARTTLEVPAIPIGVDYSVDSFSRPGQQFLYKIEVPQDSGSMAVRMVSSAVGGSGSLYLQRSFAPSPWEFDQSKNVTGAEGQWLVRPKAVAGTYYLLVRADAGAIAASPFTIRVELRTELEITSIDTTSAGHSAQVTIEIRGYNFTPNTIAKLATSERTIEAERIDFRDESKIYATFLVGGPDQVGAYQLRIHDGLRVSNSVPFQIVDPHSQGDGLQIELDIPSAVRHHGQIYTGVIRYTNLNNFDLVAPLLQLNATHARLSLPSQVNMTGEIEAASLQFLATAPDGPAGILRPGQSGMQAFYFQPVPDGDIDFDVSFEVASLDSARSIDWSSVLAEIRPSFVQAYPWQILSNKLISLLGTSTDQYVARLAKAATYLSEIGEPASNVQELWTFLLAQVDGIIGFPAQESAVDLELDVPGLSLSITRSYLGTISSENRRGIFGLGWSTMWESSIAEDAFGNVTVFSGARSRFFERQPNGTYRGGAGEYGTLTRSNGVFSITEVGGDKLVFLANGNLNFVEDTNANRITLDYNSAGQLVAIRHSSGEAFFLSYTSNTHDGLISRIEDGHGRHVLYHYEEIPFSGGPRLTSAEGPLGSTHYVYKAGTAMGYQVGDGSLIQVTNPDGTHRYYSSDENGGEFHRDGGAESSRFVAAGDGKFYLFDSFENRSTVWLNTSGVVARIVDAQGNMAAFRYDRNSNLVRSDGPLGASKNLVYDDRGNLTQVTNPLGNTIHMVYGGTFGGLTQVVDALGNTTRYAYDAKGNLTQVTYPGGGAEKFQYDSQGNPKEKVNRRGDAIRTSKDARGRTIRIDFEDLSFQTFAYDQFDNLLTASDASGTIVMTYERPETSRLSRIDYPDGRFLTFNYDAGGRRTRSTDQEGFTIEYEYDDVGRLSGLRDGSGGLIVDYFYDKRGDLVRKENGNGTVTTFTYDASGRIVSLQNFATVQPQLVLNSGWTYTYDAAGRVSSSTDESGTTRYGYDAAGQLISVIQPNGRTIFYEYDAAGNRKRVVDSQLGTTTYVVNNENEIVQTQGSLGAVTYQYDADGNLISTQTPNGTTSYVFDALNQLKTVSDPVGTTTYLYNALGDRVSATRNGVKTSYVIDPIGLGNIVAEYGSNHTHFVYGLGLVSQVSSGGTGYYDFDLTGNTEGITNVSGEYINRYRYLPFGETISTVSSGLSNPFTYIGSFGVTQESNGLSYMRARYYSTSTGQFLSNDPIGLTSGDFNQRRYVGNSPILFIDPMGLKSIGKTVAQKAENMFWDKAKEVAKEKWDEFTGKKGLEDADKELAKGQQEVMDGNQIIQDQINSADDTNAAENYSRGQSLRSHGTATAFRGGGRLALRLVSDSSSPGFAKKLGSALHAPHLPTLSDLVQYAKGLRSIDPNDLIGPPGYGPLRYKDPSGSFSYRIEFENLSSATAPALEVRVSHQLDSDLDFRTFELVSFGFGSELHTLPAGLQQYRTKVEYRNPDGSPLLVSVRLEFDSSTGKLEVVFDSVDPVTGIVPLDALAGFLPPENGSKMGQGFVQFMVKPKQGSSDGTRIEQSATIFFDGQPLATPVYLNTTDRSAPVASVAALAPLQNSTFTLQWTGNDGQGAGIASYDVYVSENQEPYTPLLANTQKTSVLFTGRPKSTYSFYVLARDNLGLTGVHIGLPDAETTISALAWQNAINPLDVNQDTFVSPLDVLILINEINVRGSHDLLPLRPETEPYLDPDGDQAISPLDVLVIINDINRRPNGGDGEQSQLVFVPSFETNKVWNHSAGNNVAAFIAVEERQIDLQESFVARVDDPEKTLKRPQPRAGVCSARDVGEKRLKQRKEVSEWAVDHVFALSFDYL
jgi:RHS repeat-associated protein